MQPLFFSQSLPAIEVIETFPAIEDIQDIEDFEDINLSPIIPERKKVVLVDSEGSSPISIERISIEDIEQNYKIEKLQECAEQLKTIEEGARALRLECSKRLFETVLTPESAVNGNSQKYTSFIFSLKFCTNTVQECFNS